MENVAIILIVSVIVALICLYLYRAKKRGEACIGCPYAKQCAKAKCGGCNSHNNPDNT